MCLYPYAFEAMVAVKIGDSFPGLSGKSFNKFLIALFLLLNIEVMASESKTLKIWLLVSF